MFLRKLSCSALQCGSASTATVLPRSRAIKRRSPSRPSPNGHLTRRDRGLPFLGEEIGGWSRSPYRSSACTHRVRHLAGSFSDPPASRKRRRCPRRELSVFPTDFSIKLRKRPAGARRGEAPTPHVREERRHRRIREGK